MLRDPLDPFWRIDLFLQNPGNDRCGVIIVDTLADNACAAEANLVFIESASEELPNDRSQSIREGKHAFSDKPIKGVCRFDHFLGHQLPEPRRPPFIEDAEKS